MKYKWIGKKIKPAFAVLMIEDFLKAKGFKIHVTEDHLGNSFKLLGVTQTHEGKRRIIIVVNKTAEGLEVDFVSGEHEKALMKLSSLISLFGAGALLVNFNKKLSFYEKIEDELWRYLQEKFSSSPSLSKSGI